MSRVIDLTKLTPNQTKHLNEIAKKDANVYTAFIDGLSEALEGEFWSALPLASRNVTLCDAFLDYCKLKLLIEEVGTEHYEKIIVPDECMKRAVVQNLKGEFDVEIKKNDRKFIKRNCRKLYSLCAFLYFWLRIIAVKINSKGFNFSIVKKETTLVNTYYLPAQFNEDGYSDRYFPGLEINDDSIIYVAALDFNTLKQGWELSGKVSDLGNVLILEKYAGWRQFLKSVEYFCRSWQVSRDCCFCNEIDMSEIIQRELVDGCYSVNSLYGVVYTSIFDELLEKGILRQPYKMIFWYEGQPLSNLLIEMIRHKYSDIITVAFVFSPMPEHFIELSPSYYQVLKNKVAHIYAVQGDYWKDAVKRFCGDNVICERAPSFRFNNIFFNKKMLLNDCKNLLVVLPIDRRLSSEFLYVVIEALEACDDFYTIFIKNHPANQGKVLYDYLPEIELKKTSVSYACADMRGAIENMAGVILSDTTAVLEIALMGVPFLVYTPQGYFSKLCDPMGIMDIAGKNEFYDSEEMREKLHDFSSCRIESGDLEAMREKLFCKVTNESVRNFLK